MKKSSPPCRIGSVLKKSSPASAAQGQSGGQPDPPGLGSFTSPFLSEQYSSDSPPGLGNFAAPGGPTHSS